MPRTKREPRDVNLPVPITRELSTSAPLTFQARPNPVERRDDGIGVTPPAGEVGVADTRLNVLSGATLFPFNPDELTRAKGGLRVYDEMRRDEQVKAALFFKKAAILGPGWQLRARGDTNAEKQLAKTLTEDLETLDGVFDDDLFEMLSSIDYGYCLHGDTIIHGPGGDRPIRELVGQRPWVYSWMDGQLRLAKASRVWKTKTDDCVRVFYAWYASGRRHTGAITCTKDHPFQLLDGSYREAGTLRPNDRLAPFAQMEKGVGARPYIRQRGFVQTQRGYGKSKWQSRARWVWEARHGKRVPKGWHVHHRDGDTLNDDPNNLEALPQSEHTSHHTREWFASAGPDRIAARTAKIGVSNNNPAVREAKSRGSSEANRRNWQDPEVRAKRVAGMRAYIRTKEHAGNISRAWTPERRRAQAEQLRQNLAKGSVENHRVIAVEPAGRHDVYDMEVPGTHNFAANTVFVHNSVSELIWADEPPASTTSADTPKGPRIRLKAIKTRAPHAIDFRVDPFGNVLDIVQLQASGRVRLPPDKFIHLVHNPEFSNPYGRSDLYHAYLSWFYKKNIQQFWMIWMEMLSNPPVVGTFPKGDDDRATAVRAMLAKLQARTAMTVPEGWDISLLESTRTPEQIFIVCIDRLDMAIARALLVPEKTGFAGGSVRAGSFALANVQADSFMYVLKLISRRLQETVQEQIINRMAQWEAPGVPAPEFLLLPASENSTLQISDTWIRAVTGQVVLSELDDENHLRELLGFPKREQRPEDAAVEVITGTTPDVVPQPTPTGRRDLPKKPPPGAVAGVGAGTKPGASRQPIGIIGQTTVVSKRMAETLPSRAEAERTVAVPDSFWRSLTPLEERCDMAEKQTLFETRTPTLARTIGAGVRDLVRDVATRAKRLVGLSPAKARTLTANQRIVARLRRAMVEALRAAYDTAAKQARAELRRAKTTMAETVTFEAGLIGSRAEQYFRARAFQVTGVLEDDVLQAAQNVLLQTLKQDKTDRQIAFELDQALGDFLPEEDAAGNVVNVPARLETIARTQLADVVNEARYGVFTDPDLEGFVEAFTYTAILDSRTRPNHRAWDQVTLAVDDPHWYAPVDNRPPAGYNCRCILIPVTALDSTELTPASEIPSVPARDEGF